MEIAVGLTTREYPSFPSDGLFTIDNRMLTGVSEMSATVFTGNAKPVEIESFFDIKSATLFASGWSVESSIKVVFFNVKLPWPGCMETGTGINDKAGCFF